MMKSLFTLLPNCIVININMKHVFIVYFQDYNLYINLVIMMENWYHVVLQLPEIAWDVTVELIESSAVARE